MYRLIFLCILFIVSCDGRLRSGNSFFFELKGGDGKEAVLYRVEKPKRAVRPFLTPVQRVATGEVLLLPRGRYFIANECSSFEFDHDRHQKVPLGVLKLQLNGQPPKEDADFLQNNIFNTSCLDPLDKKEHAFQNKAEFDILPGKNNFFIGGRRIELNSERNNPLNAVLNLNAISVTTPATKVLNQYFISPIKVDTSEENIVVSAPLGSTMWLLPGKYLLEVNGSQKEVSLEQGNSLSLGLGILKITLPQNFPMASRLQAGGQPIFAYINEKVLFNLDTEYPVFPGKYKVSLEDSEISVSADVAENEKTLVKTVGAQINVPPCPARYKQCKALPKVTIHASQSAIPLMSVDTNIPFVVFSQEYQYGVEGVRGILRTLSTSVDSIKVESLVRVKLKWEIRANSIRSSRTSLVLFETKGSPLFGRSLDLLFAKPDEVYLPFGSYDLAYFVDDSSQDRVKNKIDFFINGGETRELIVPIFSDRVAHTENDEEGGQGSGGQEQTNKNQPAESKQLPYSLSPIN